MKFIPDYVHKRVEIREIYYMFVNWSCTDTFHYSRVPLCVEVSENIRQREAALAVQVGYFGYRRLGTYFVETFAEARKHTPAHVFLISIKYRKQYEHVCLSINTLNYCRMYYIQACFCAFMRSLFTAKNRFECSYKK